MKRNIEALNNKLNGEMYLQKSGLKELAEAFRSFMHTYFKDSCKKSGFSAALDAIVNAVPNSSYYLTTWYGKDNDSDWAKGDGHLNVVNSSFETGQFANFNDMWDPEGYENTETYTPAQKNKYAALRQPHNSNLREFDALSENVSTRLQSAHAIINNVSANLATVKNNTSTALSTVAQLCLDISNNIVPSIMTNINA